MRHADCKVLARTFYSSKTFYKMLKSASLQHSQDQSSLLQWIAICMCRIVRTTIQCNECNILILCSIYSIYTSIIYTVSTISTYLQYPAKCTSLRPAINYNVPESVCSIPADIVWCEQPDFVLNLRSFATFSLPTLDRN